VTLTHFCNALRTSKTLFKLSSASP